MKSKSILIIALIFSQLQFFAQKLEWHTDFEKARKIAKESNKTLLLDFTGSDWCGYCIKLRRDVFEDPEFEKWAKDKLVLVELDFPRKKTLPAKIKEQNEKLQGQFMVRGFPSIYFITAEGGFKGAMGGYRDLYSWIEQADEIVERNTVGVIPISDDASIKEGVVKEAKENTLTIWKVATQYDKGLPNNLVHSAFVDYASRKGLKVDIQCFPYLFFKKKYAEAVKKDIQPDLIISNSSSIFDELKEDKALLFKKNNTGYNSGGSTENTLFMGRYMTANKKSLYTKELREIMKDMVDNYNFGFGGF